MASLGLHGQLFIQILAQELGATEAGLEAALVEALYRVGYTSLELTQDAGGLTVNMGTEDKNDYYKRPCNFEAAKARLGRR